jgi:hypothetical protein
MTAQEAIEQARHEYEEAQARLDALREAGISTHVHHPVYLDAQKKEVAWRKLQVLQLDPTAFEEPPLPIPTTLGGPDVPFKEAVRAYAQGRNVTLKEVWERIGRITGNTPSTLSKRYSSPRGSDVWHAGGGTWTGIQGEEHANDFMAGMTELVEQEVERRVGRPEVGPMVNVRMPEELIAWVDEQVAQRGGTRAAFVRDVLQAAKEAQR